MLGAQTDDQTMSTNGDIAARTIRNGHASAAYFLRSIRSAAQNQPTEDDNWNETKETPLAGTLKLESLHGNLPGMRVVKTNITSCPEQ
jgi:hypothetical protein